ncbi:hypothetical protein AVEN_243988-1 [Araneus ventricosus]|uniref:Uncharacterized protein n=1 Tax=Araneus ventricosus TaxID=182803 RepID=A0A4Y2ILJ7_ARAVE|nr:hypothetical protein AVEN_243988-1 [Araneus ventricosus]
MRTDLSENWRRCDIISLPVNVIYLDCSSKVNSTNNESTNAITIRCVGYIFINAEIGPEGNCAHRFIIPAVNFGSTDYVERQAFYVTPPPFLRQISPRVLLKMIQDYVPMDGWDFIKFPSHTQAVQRVVKLVTEASRKRVGPQNRDGFIRATLESRTQMSQFESKTDYKK